MIKNQESVYCSGAGSVVMATTCQNLETMGRENHLEDTMTAFTDLEQIFAQACETLITLPETPELSLPYV